jgi:ABC-type glycerol-3-phosphate transport system substrate-binding protein
MVTVKFVPMWGIGEFGKELAAEFMEQNPDIRIEFRDDASLAVPDYDERLLAAYEAGDPYDMVLAAPFYSIWATQAGHTVDPAPLFERDFGPDYRSLFTNSFIWWQGKIVGVPFKRGLTLCFYNRDIIEAERLPLPHEDWTWDEFVRIATSTLKYAPDGSVTQWGCAALEWELFSLYVESEGQRLFSPDYRKATIDTPLARSAMRAVHDLVFKHKAMGTPAQWLSATGGMPTSWNHEAFYTGKAALMFDGDLRVAEHYRRAAQTGFRLGVAPLPTRKIRVADAGVSVFQIWKCPDAERTAAAWEFAKLWLTPRNQARLMVTAGHAPIREDAYDEPIAKEALRRWPGLKVARNAYQCIDPSVGITEYPTKALEYSGIRPTANRMMRGELTADETVQVMQATCQEVLDRFWDEADRGVFRPFPEGFH